MTESERQLWVAKCGEILHWALIEIRALAWEPGHDKQIEELADLTHNLPRYITGQDDFALNGLREGFLRYAAQYWPDSDPDRTRYVELLDMDEIAFAGHYRRTESEGWPEPVPEVVAH